MVTGLLTKMRIPRDILIPGILAVAFVTVAVTSAARKSPTCDEAAHHIPAGYVLLTKGDLAFSPETPPLARYLAAVPLLFLDLKLPDDRAFWARDDRAEFSREFLYSLNRRLAGLSVFLARLPMILVGAFGGVFLFAWVRKRYGALTAIFAGVFYFLSPNILAHARLAATDITATVLIMCSVLLFRDILTCRGYKEVFVAGIFLGLALLSKFSALLLLPFYFAVVCSDFVARTVFRKEKGPAAGIFLRFFVCLAVSFLVLWAGYAFEFKPLLVNVLRPEDKVEFFTAAIQRILPFAGGGFTDRCVRAFYTVPVPLSSYIMGLMGVLRHGAEGARTFFMGSWSRTGHPMYYILAFFVKTPIPVIVSFLFGIFIGMKDKEHRPFNLYLTGCILLFFIVASRSDLQLGLRYILPVYPFVFLIAAQGLKSLFQGKKMFRIAGAALVLWLAWTQFFIWPDYLSYFNEIAGGPAKGYKYLRDSNIDWGQDLPALKDHMKKKGFGAVKLDYFGEGDPAWYGIDCEYITETETRCPGGHVYAISVNHLERYDWAVHTRPDATAGHSIFIYDLRKKM